MKADDIIEKITKKKPSTKGKSQLTQQASNPPKRPGPSMEFKIIQKQIAIMLISLNREEEAMLWIMAYQKQDKNEIERLFKIYWRDDALHDPKYDDALTCLIGGCSILEPVLTNH
ncbi:MAG: hypothetical protein J2P41_11005 [Blastocatellia bacterium]|nr:hypothetical protein [Blastocatellia bacterium]